MSFRFLTTVVTSSQLIVNAVAPWVVTAHMDGGVAAIFIISWIFSSAFAATELLCSFDKSANRHRGRIVHHAGLVALWATSTGVAFGAASGWYRNHEREAGIFSAVQLGLSVTMVVIAIASEVQGKKLNAPYLAVPSKYTDQGLSVSAEEVAPPRISSDSQNTVAEVENENPSYSKANVTEEAARLLP